jgi:ubiquinone/menaquinone biosynthesis C-methylase UbiE
MSEQAAEQRSDQAAWQLSDDTAVAYERDFVPAIFAQWPAKLADVAAIAPGDQVLDVACGTGVLAREAAARVGPSGRVTGLDLNEGMLAVARRLRPEIDWRQGDALDLPFADHAFDVVASQFALMFFPDRPRALREMWRVLAPGGRLAVAVCAPLEETRGYRALADILRREAGEDAAAMVEGYFALGDEAELLRLARAADIPGARVVKREGWARYASIEEFGRIEIKGSPLAGLVDAAAFERVLSAAGERLSQFRDAEGRLALPLDARIVAARKG